MSGQGSGFANFSTMPLEEFLESHEITRSGRAMPKKGKGGKGKPAPASAPALPPLPEIAERRTIVRRVAMPPFPKKRPRVTRHGTYTPGKEFYAELKAGFGHVPDAPLYGLRVTAVRQMPKSWSQKKRDVWRGKYATPVPDRDNVLGGVMDALFENDSKVVDTACKQIWGDEWGLVIELELIPASEGV